MMQGLVRVCFLLLRIGRRMLVGLVALFLIVFACLVVYTRTAHFEDFLRDQVLAALQETIDAEVSLERVRLRNWSGATLSGLAIQKDDITVATLAQADVSISIGPQLYALWRTGTLRIANVALTELVLNLVEDPQLGWNVARLLKPKPKPSSPSTLAVMVERLTLERGQVTARLADGRTFQVGSLESDGELSLPTDGLLVRLRDARGVVTEAGLPDVQWQGAVEFEEKGGEQRITLPTFELRTPQSHLQLHGDVAHLASPMISLVVAVERLASDEVKQIWPASPLSQDLSGTIQLSGPLSALQLDAAVALLDGRISATVTGDVSKATPMVQGTIQIEGVAIEEALFAPQLNGLAGRLTGKATFQGSGLQTLNADLSVFAADCMVRERSLGNVNLTVNLHSGAATFFIDNNGPGGYLYAQGMTTLASPFAYDVTMLGRQLNAKVLANDPTVAATNANLQVQVVGYGLALHHANATARLTILPSTAGALRVTAGEFAGTLRDETLTLTKGLLTANETTLAIRGQLGKAGGKLAYELAAKDLAPWLMLAGLEGQGGLQVRGNVTGAFSALQIEGTASVANLRIAERRVASGNVAYQFADVGNSQARGKIKASLNEVQIGQPLRSILADVSVTKFAPVEAQAEVTIQDGAARTHQLTTQFRYASEGSDATIEKLTIQSPAGMWQTVQAAHVALRGQRLTVDRFSLERGEQSFTISGEIDRQGALRAQIQAQQIALAEWQLLFASRPAVSGVVNAEANLQGSWAEPELTLTVKTGPLIVAEQAYAGLDVRGDYRRQWLALSVTAQQDQMHALRIEGGLPIGVQNGEVQLWTGKEANLLLRSDGLSVAFLSLLSRDLTEVKGEVSMEVQLHGPLQELVPSGVVRLQDGGFRVKKLGRTFSELTAEVQLLPDRARIARFFVRGGDGKLSGSGTIGFEHRTVGALDIALDAKRFQVIGTKEYRAAISGDIHCSGTASAPMVEGRLKLVDAVARPNLALFKQSAAEQDPTITVVYGRNTAQAGPPVVEEKNGCDSDRAVGHSNGAWGMDVTMTIPGDTWVHLEEGSIELMGKLRARKEPAQEPSLSGTVETVRGWVAMQGRKFRLERGKVQFTGGTPPDPLLDVLARYTLPDYVVDVLIGGTSKAPTISFSSEPTLEQADILALLVFGKQAQDLSDREKRSLSSQAVQTITGMIASDLRQRIASQLGVDNLEIDVGDSLAQSKIGIGKYVAPRVFVSTTQQLGETSSGQGREVSIEYQIGKDWQLKASTTTRGNNGVDLFWKKKY